MKLCLWIIRHQSSNNNICYSDRCPKMRGLWEDIPSWQLSGPAQTLQHALVSNLLNCNLDVITVWRISLITNIRRFLVTIIMHLEHRVSKLLHLWYYHPVNNDFLIWRPHYQWTFTAFTQTPYIARTQGWPVYTHVVYSVHVSLYYTFMLEWIDHVHAPGEGSAFLVIVNFCVIFFQVVAESERW